MPTVYFHTESTGINILNTVTNQVVTGLLDELDLVRYFQNAVYILNEFTAYSQYNDGNGAITLVKNRCDVKVDYIMDKSQVPWPVDSPYTTPAYGIRNNQKGNHTPILIDTDAGILIEHLTVACGISMDFILSFQTYDDACRTFDTIKTKYTGSLIQKPFDLSFSYPVSFGLLQLLTEVWKAKSDYNGKTLLDYINDKKKTQISFDVRKSQLDKPNADKQLMIRCQQLNCLAQLNMDQREPEGHMVDQLPDSFTVNFNLTVQFGRPNLIAVHTPVSVDNTVLPYGLFENCLINYTYNPNVAGVYQDLMCNEFMKRSYGNYNNAHQITRLPAYDDWFVADTYYARYNYRPVIVAHFTLDGPMTTFNIATLDDVTLHPIVQDILKQTGSSVFDFGGLFHIGVFADDTRLGKNLLNIDENLNLSVTSNRNDKSYHLVVSETTNLQKTDTLWDNILVKYRYFFPMTIERNIQRLIKNKYFYIATENRTISLISKLFNNGQIKSVLSGMVTNNEITNEIYSYTQNPSQLADYMAYTQSQNITYTLPTGSDSTSVLVREYYSTVASVSGRSLLVVFIEECLKRGFIDLTNVPDQYLKPNDVIYPYYQGTGGYYGFNTPLRVLTYNIGSEQRT